MPLKKGSSFKDYFSVRTRSSSLLIRWTDCYVYSGFSEQLIDLLF